MSLGRQRIANASQQRPRIAQMFEDIRQDDGIRVVRQPADGFEIGDDDLIESPSQITDAIDVVFKTDRPLEAAAQRLTELSAGGAEVEEGPGAVGITTDQIDENAMTAAFEVFECVDVRHQYSDHGLPLESVPGAALWTSTIPVAGVTAGAPLKSVTLTDCSVTTRQSAAPVMGSFGIEYRYFACTNSLRVFGGRCLSARKSRIASRISDRFCRMTSDRAGFGSPHAATIAIAAATATDLDRKSTRLNSSHGYTSYA